MTSFRLRSRGVALRTIKTKTLDLLNISVAGMRDGVGPLLTIFLIQNTHWTPLHLSWVLAAPGVANILVQIPVGILFDRLKFQGVLIATGAVLMAVAAFGISMVPDFNTMLVIQLVSGLACCLISVGIPAISLSLVSSSNFGSRLARNEIFSKLGNFGAIAATGYLCQKFSLHWMFYVVFMLAAMVIFSSLQLRNTNFQPLEVEGPAGSPPAVVPAVITIPPQLQLRNLICRILAKTEFTRIVFVACLYQLSNASLFLIFEQSFVRQQKNGGAGIISAALFATQLVIIVASLSLARWKTAVNPVKLLGFGFLLIVARSLCFALQLGLSSLFMAQILDGCIAAILIIVPIRAIAFLNDENFNVMSGVLGMCVALGASVSTVFAGYVIGKYGFVPAFLTFGALAFVGLLISGLLGAEKRPSLNQV